MASQTAMSVAVGRLVRSSSVGAAFGSPMMMVGARRERRRYARLRASRKSFVSSSNGTCVSSTFSCHPGPTHSYAPRRPSTPMSGWAYTVTDECLDLQKWDTTCKADILRTDTPRSCPRKTGGTSPRRRTGC